jgi:hypothetical protein
MEAHNGKCIIRYILHHKLRRAKKYATIFREFKEGYMKVNYQERIDATARELKIILSEQRTITRSTKDSNTLLVEIRI